MNDTPKLNAPWLVAVWPGMGQVAVSAGYYLMAKLEVDLLAEFRSSDLFDVEHVEVESGLVQKARLPRSRFFVWRDPAEMHDVVIFIGEAQPPMGKYPFCGRLMDFVEDLGVERIFTFAAMATNLRPEQPSRVFGAATDEKTLAELQQLDVEVLEEGQIGGLNGVLLGVAAERELRGVCLLGEMPHVFVQLPYPKASLAVLERFTKIANLNLDFSELREQTRVVDERLAELYESMEDAMQKDKEEEPAFEEPAEAPEPAEPRLAPEDERRIEQLFQQAHEDRSKAYELKRELDRLHVFAEYEDRFLDLFKKPE